jgi:hypothetical protein
VRIGGAGLGMSPALEVIGILALAPEDFEAAISGPRDRRIDRRFIAVNESTGDPCRGIGIAKIHEQGQS